MAFEECPVLPKPSGFDGVRETGHSSSSSNGKTTRISYTYGFRGNGTAEELLDLYTAKLTERKAFVPEGRRLFLRLDGQISLFRAAVPKRKKTFRRPDTL